MKVFESIRRTIDVVYLEGAYFGQLSQPTINEGIEA